MTEPEGWDYILGLDEELLQGGVVLSEWSAALVRDADIAFVSGANLAAVLTAQAAMEAHLRFESVQANGERHGFFELINNSELPLGTKDQLHAIRKFRNRWVHVNDPADDQELLEGAERLESELKEVARVAIRVMREILYHHQSV